MAALLFEQDLTTTASAYQKAKQHLDAIRRNRVRQLVMRIENGWHCIQIKELIGHGHWVRYILEGNVGYASLRTIERDMALADALYEYRDQLDGADQFSSASALSLLSNIDNADGEMSAVDTALALMKRGVRVTTAAARQLALVAEVLPEYNDKIAAGEISIQDAAAVSGALKDAGGDAQLKTLIERGNVKSAELVKALADVQQYRPDQFEDIVNSSTIYHPLTETPIPLSQASASDLRLLLNYEDTEREARRQSHIRDWKNSKPAPALDITGKKSEILKSIEQLPGDFVFRVIVYAAADAGTDADSAAADENSTNWRI